MGQKVNPIANRLGIIRGWDSNWFGGKDFSDKLVEDAKIRKYLNVRLAKASISKIIIERTLKLVTVTISTARPGIIIGKGGQEVDKLKEELEEVRRVRATQRQRRQKNEIPVVAIVGYTNAGKSTLLNAITGAGIPANDRLFDTLDTTTRLLTVSDTLDVVISDTVGFIRKLPHQLVEAFKATLEELEYADLLLHVIDSADPNRQEHIAVVDKLITTLAKPGTPVLYCYNKADLVSREDIPVGENIVAVSAAKGVGMEALLQRIEEMLGHARHHVVLCLPYSMGGQVDALHSGAKVNSVDYTAGGIEIDAVLDDILYGRLREYVTKEI